MAAEGPVGYQHGLPQEGHRLLVVELHQPAFPCRIGAGDAQVAEAVDRRHGEIQVERTGLKAPAPQQASHGEEVVDQRQVLLEGLEACRGGARLRLPLRQRQQSGGVKAGGGKDRAELEAEVLQTAVCRQIEGNGYGFPTFAGHES